MTALAELLDALANLVLQVLEDVGHLVEDLHRICARLWAGE